MPRSRGPGLRACVALTMLALAPAACDARETPVRPQKPVAGGVLRVAVRELPTLDPAKATGRGSAFVFAHVFDSLTAASAAGIAQPAAAKFWTTSADGLTWTFELAAASFHDGARVTAYDFKFAFDRIALKSIASEAAFQLEPVAGFKAARIDGTATALSGVQPVDIDTLRIVLDRPFYELPLFLAHPALGPVSQKVFNRDPKAFAQRPIGNGPFLMAEPRTDRGVELRRFDKHTGSTALLDGVSVATSSDSDEGWRAYRQGTADVAEVPAAAIESSRGAYGPAGFSPFWAVVYYGPNLRLEKFKKPEARRAIALAIDRAAIASRVYGGTKTPATGLVPRGIPGFAVERCAECVRDQSLARTLVRQAYGTTPPEIIVDHLDNSSSREVAAAVAANLREIGIPARTRAHESSEYLRTLQAGRQELGEFGWFAEVPSPDPFLAQQLKTGSPNNQVGFSDSGFDSLIDRARGEREEVQRRTLYRNAELRALERLPLIPVVFFRNHLAVASKVRDLRVDGAGLFDAATVWLAP
ncbi:MAG: peptide ABC transporter substrate-binding protein [Actinomycetota bacterium]